MKRFISLITTAAVALAMVITLAGCKDNSSNKVQPEEMVEYEIAMITDDSLVMDGGNSEAAWSAITEFGAGNGISHKYYKATEATKNAYKEAIKTAVKKGAGIIILDGYTFGDTEVSFEGDYSDVNFIVLNATPVDEKPTRSESPIILRLYTLNPNRRAWGLRLWPKDIPSWVS